MDSEKRIKALALSAGGGAGSCLARWRETGDVLSLFKVCGAEELSLRRHRSDIWIGPVLTQDAGSGVAVLWSHSWRFISWLMSPPPAPSVRSIDAVTGV